MTLRPATALLPLSLCLACATGARAEQFVLFDDVFLFELKDAMVTDSHIMVNADKFNKATPKDWTQPVDYRHGTLHIRYEVLEKPPGDVPTMWSICYIPIKGQKNNYGCASSPTYSMPGVYDKDEDMTRFWENDSIVWSDGIKMMTLVLKAANVQGKNKAHLQSDPSKFFPTKVHVTLIQVAKGSTYDAGAVPGLKGAQGK